MTETTEEKPAVVSIPIVKRRADLKKKIRGFKFDLHQKEKQLDDMERHIYSSANFASNKSDLAGRKRELQTILKNNDAYQVLLSEIEQLEFTIEEHEDMVSNINFYQRERLVIAADRYDKSIETLNEALNKFSESIQSFEASVYKFVSSRKSQ